MNERCYFASTVITASVDKFFLWYSDEVAGVLLENKRIRTFPSMSVLIEYCNEHGLTLSQDPVAIFDLGSIAQRIADIDAGRVDHEALLNFWNLMDDVQRSISGDTAISDDDLDLHEKLSFSCFDESMPGMFVKEGYQPDWNPTELARLAIILRSQLMVLEAVL